MNRYTNIFWAKWEWCSSISVIQNYCLFIYWVKYCRLYRITGQQSHKFRTPLWSPSFHDDFICSLHKIHIIIDGSYNLSHKTIKPINPKFDFFFILCKKPIRASPVTNKCRYCLISWRPSSVLEPMVPCVWMSWSLGYVDSFFVILE